MRTAPPTLFRRIRLAMTRCSAPFATSRAWGPSDSSSKVWWLVGVGAALVRVPRRLVVWGLYLNGSKRWRVGKVVSKLFRVFRHMCGLVSLALVWSIRCCLF